MRRKWGLKTCSLSGFIPPSGVPREPLDGRKTDNAQGKTEMKGYYGVPIEYGMRHMYSLLTLEEWACWKVRCAVRSV